MHLPAQLVTIQFAHYCVHVVVALVIVGNGTEASEVSKSILQQIADALWTNSGNATKKFIA